MMRIKVHTAFNLTKPDSTTERFDVGEHTVSEDIGNHWFVKAHSEPVDTAEQDKREADLKSQLDAREAELDKREADLVKREKALKKSTRGVDDGEKPDATVDSAI